jgi:hypothetical protein
MLTQDQLNREAHHRLSQAPAAFHWRARAEKARKAALIMTTETETLMWGQSRGLRIPRAT